MTDIEFAGFFVQLVTAGNDTTKTMLSSGTEALLAHPDQLAALRADRSLMGGAVEEILRYVNPLHYFRRTALADTELAGVPIAEGDKVAMMYTSANRDEAVFGDTAQEFDIRRSPNPHVSFGFAAHFCLGVHLARLEGKVFFDELLDTFSTIEQTGPLAAHPLQPQQRVEAAADPPRSMSEPNAQRLHVADPFDDWPKDDVAASDERTTLMAFLDYHRAVLARKATGLTDEQARLATCPPSDLTMLGLIRHAADVERGWALRSMAGGDAAPIYYGASHPDGDPDGDFHPPSDATVAEALDTYWSEIARADEIYAADELEQIEAARPWRVQPALDPPPPDRGARPPLRSRRPAPPGDRRGDRRLNRERPSAPAPDVATVPPP